MTKTWLFVLPWKPTEVGGVTQVVLALADHFSRRQEWRPLILVNDWAAVRPVWNDWNGMRYVQLRISPFTSDPVAALKYFLRAPSELLTLAAFLRQQQVHVVNLHYLEKFAVTIALLSLFRLFRGSVIISTHGTDLLSLHQTRPLERKLLHFALNRATAVTVHPCNRGSLSGRNVRVLPNGIEVDPQPLSPASPAGHFAPGSPAGPTAATLLDPPVSDDLRLDRPASTILSVTRFKDFKAPDLLVEAFAEVLHDVPQAMLVLIAADGTERAATQLLIEQLGIKDRISLLVDAPHSVTLEYFNRASIFVLPSRRETFSVALLEAGRAGLAVVATDVGDNGTIVEHGRSGILVPPDDAPAMANAIRSLLDSPSLARQYGAALRVRVEQNFALESVYDRLTALANMPE